IFHDLQLHLEGDAVFSKKDDAVNLHTSFTLAKDANGTLDVIYKDDIVDMTLKAPAFDNIYFLKKFIPISDNVAPWIFKRLEADSYTVTKLRSQFSFNRPSDFLENLDLTGEVTNFSYTFADKLYPLTAPSAKLHYQYGSLSIEPTNPTYNKKDLTGSKVNLLYLLTKPSVSLVLRTNETVDQDMIDILDYYKVPFPVSHKDGTNELATDLLIDLINGNVQYDARIKLFNSNITLGGVDLFVKKSTVQVKDNILTISDTRLDDEDSIKGSVAGQVDLKNTLGHINVDIETLDLGLMKTRTPFTFEVLFKENETVLNTQDSNWRLINGYDFSLFNRQYVLSKDLKLVIPSTRLYDPKRIDISFNGFIDFKNNNYDMTLLLDNLILSEDEDNKTLNLVYPVQFKADPKTYGSFENNRPILFSNGKDNISIEKISFVSDNEVTFKMDNVRFNNYLSTNIDAYYNPKIKLGRFDFLDLQMDLNNSDPAYLKLKEKRLSFSINAQEDLRIYSKQLKSGYKKQNKQHVFHVDDVSAITYASPLLQSIHNKKGKILIKTEDFKTYQLYSKLKDFEVTGFINDKVDKSIDIIGSIDKHGLKATINKNISVALGKTIEVSLEDTGFDLRWIFEDSNNSTKSESFKTPINVKGKNGYVILKDKNQLIFELLQAQIQGDAFYANIKHDKGQAIMFSEHNQIEIFGEKFNDKFAANLMGFSGFKGGNYSFYMKGDQNLTHGGIHVEDATAKDFALYNNLLAYLNTIPALLTFQSPGFNAEGFKIKKGDIGFKKEKDLITLKSMKLYGRSSNIFGEGTVNLANDKLDLTLRIFLLKDMGSIIGSIPIAGYLLLGDDNSLTTTLTVTGTIQKPKVTVNLAKDLIMAPINIIKRTFSLPAKFLHWLTGDDE
ncbi:MAG: AsmA-like C-terminal domain-containing protein, partial [Thiovulaceae bacterium]|nr:AsmA-like C-terminal domain-containing protein [Sulfurimonadaceae bacterium]